MGFNVLWVGTMARKKETILIVDDTPANLDVLRALLSERGYHVRVASGGAKALASVRAGLPDLILLDIRMPDLDGFEVCRRLKADEDSKPIPVIFLSAAKEPEDKIQAFSVGGVDYITKPFQKEEVLARIRTHLNLKALNENLEFKVYERTRELQEQRALLQRSLDALSHPFYVINVEDYTVALANRASHFQKFPHGAKCYESVHQRSEPCAGTDHPCTIQEVLKKKGPVVLEHYHVDENGAEQYVEVHAYPVFNEGGQIVQVIEYCIDISERRKNEIERMRLTAVIEQTADSIVITDNKAIIQYVNPSFERITGYSASEAIGKDFKILYGGLPNSQFHQEMWDTLSNGKVWRGHLINKKKDGALFDEEVSITPVQDDNGKIINYVALERDVTKQKKLEEQLQQAQKMEAIGTLAGGIAHDFNNILGVILGYADLAKEDALPFSHLSRYIEKIIIAGNRAKDLVKQILAISRKTKVQKNIISPQPIIMETVKMLRASIPVTIEIQEEISKDCGPIYADPTQLHQIVMNLCTNAFHAMDSERGVLSVQLRETDAVPEELKEKTEENPFVEISVRDTGSGISPDIIGNIFDPFFTTKEVGKGTGMGLSIVYRIIKDYGGTVTVESQEGKGSVFRLYIPRSRHEAVAEDVAKEELPKGRETVLFIDDEELLVEMGKNILERLGYHVIAHQSSLDALSTFQKSPGDFDVVITDQTMPDMTGVEVATRMLRIRPDIPIILCSGYSSFVDETNAKSHGIKEFVQKPFSKGTIAQLIRKVLE